MLSLWELDNSVVNSLNGRNVVLWSNASKCTCGFDIASFLIGSVLCIHTCTQCVSTFYTSLKWDGREALSCPVAHIQFS